MTGWEWLWLPGAILPVAYLYGKLFQKMLPPILKNYILVQLEGDVHAAKICAAQTLVLIGASSVFSWVGFQIFVQAPPSIFGVPSWIYVFLSFIVFWCSERAYRKWFEKRLFPRLVA